jgi:hypothetical protein
MPGNHLPDGVRTLIMDRAGGIPGHILLTHEQRLHVSLIEGIADSALQFFLTSVNNSQETAKRTDYF